MHLIATCLLLLIDWACNTSENVPSPFLEISRYSKINFAVRISISKKWIYFLKLLANNKFMVSRNCFTPLI
jgi:hypothetical protein